MDDVKCYSNSGGFGFLMSSILAFAIGYLVYDGIKGALFLFAFNILMMLVALFGLIPFVGVFLTYHLGKYEILPLLLSETGFEVTWATSLFFWLQVASSVIFTIIITILCILILTDR